MKKARAVAAVGFNSREAARLAGASLRQLQWWDEHGIVIPNGQQSRRDWRLYSRAQVIEARLVVELRRKGLPLGPIRKALGAFRGETGFLLVDLVGHTRLCLSAADALDRAIRMASAVFVVNIARLAAHIP